MTRKHFEALAEELRFAHPTLSGHDTYESRIVWTKAVRAVADACSQFNWAFDRDRFYRAATPGVDTEPDEPGGVDTEANNFGGF